MIEAEMWARAPGRSASRLFASRVMRSIAALRRRWTRLDSAIALSALLLVAAVWAVTFERIRFEESETASKTVRENRNLAVAYEEHTVSTLRGVEQTLQRVMHEYQQRGRQLNIQKLFASGAIAPGIYSFVGIADTRGNIVLGSREFQPTRVADREWFEFHEQNAGKQLFIGKPVVGRITGRWTIHMTQRMNKPDGSFGGVVFASVDPTYFTRFYQKAQLGEHGLAALIGRDDGVARAKRLGSAVSFGLEMGGTTWFSQLSSRGHGEYQGTDSLDSVDRYVSYRALSEYPLVVQVGASRDEVLAEFRVRERNYTVNAALASLLVGLIAFGFAAALRRQRYASEALAASDARFRGTFEQAAIGIVNVAMDGRFVRVNRVYCNLLGYTEDELLLLTIPDITHPEDLALAAADVRGLLDNKDNGAGPAREKRNIRRDGSLVWVSVAVSLVRDVQGNPDYFVAMVQDISARKQAEARYRATFTQAGVGIGLSNLDGSFIEANGKMCEMLGYAPDELLDLNVRDILAPGELPAVYEDRKKLEAREVDCAVREFRYVRKDGSSGWVIRGLSPVRDASGNIEYMITVVQDISERKRAEAQLYESQEKLEQLASHIPQAFWIADVQLKELIYLSPAYEAIFGMRHTSLADALQGWQEAIHPEDRERALTAHRNVALKSLDERYRIVRPDRSVRWLHARAFPVRNGSGEVYRLAGTVEDITESHELKARLQYQAHFDALTGLPNRTLCYDRLQQALVQAQRRQGRAAVLFLDLDRFKPVNDTLGHLFGDQLLCQVSERLQQCVGGDDTVGRLGGDEFAIVLAELAHTADAALVAQRVIDTLEQPLRLDGHEVFISASIGIAVYPGDGEDADMLLRNADAAMFNAKKIGRGNYRFYTAGMNAHALEKLVMESKLRHALERNEFVLHFQPKADLNEGRLTGCEALLRWQIPGKATMPPAQFVPLLEESGLIVPVGEWVVRAACRQLRAWQDAGIAPLPVAVNLSAKQFQHQDVCAMVERALRDFEVDPRLLELEVTESAAMFNPDEAMATLRKLKALGVHLLIDDFGTGYSSLSYLKRFPVDFLKLDRSFVAGLPHDADDASIACAVITMAHSLGLKVVAEGVETEEQLAFLSANGCDEMQGFYLSRPVPGAEYTQWLVQRRGLAARVRAA